MIGPQPVRPSGLRTTLIVVLLVTLLFVETAVVMAAIDGDFSTQYDGYDGDPSTETLGREITVEGEIRVTGTSAVNPRITITGGKWTVLETRSVSSLVPGEQSVDLTKRYGPSRARLAAEEIPAGTTIRLKFTVYFIGGTTKQNITSANIRVDYSTPSGESQRKLFTVYTQVENSPDRRIRQLEEQDPGTGNGPSIGTRVLSWIGMFTIGVLILVVVYSLLSNGSDDDRRRRRRRNRNR